MTDYHGRDCFFKKLKGVPFSQDAELAKYAQSD